MALKDDWYVDRDRTVGRSGKRLLSHPQKRHQSSEAGWSQLARHRTPRGDDLRCCVPGESRVTRAAGPATAAEAAAVQRITTHFGGAVGLALAVVVGGRSTEYEVCAAVGITTNAVCHGIRPNTSHGINTHENRASPTPSGLGQALQSEENYFCQFLCGKLSHWHCHTFIKERYTMRARFSLQKQQALTCRQNKWSLGYAITVPMLNMAITCWAEFILFLLQTLENGVCSKRYRNGKLGPYQHFKSAWNVLL